MNDTRQGCFAKPSLCDLFIRNELAHKLDSSAGPLWLIAARHDVPGDGLGKGHNKSFNFIYHFRSP